MKKEITLGQLLGVGATLLIAIATGWMTMSNKISEQGMQIKNLQERQDKVESAIFGIQTDIRLILVKLQDKKDRDK